MKSCKVFVFFYFKNLRQDPLALGRPAETRDSFYLGGALGLPEDYGSISVTGFVRFSDAIRDDRGVGLNDEFYGGVSIGYEW